MKPTERQIGEYRNYCFNKRLMEITPSKFDEVLSEWSGELSQMGCLSAIKEHDLLMAGQILAGVIYKEISYYVELDVRRYIEDFEMSEAAARSDERYDRRKDMAL